MSGSSREEIEAALEALLPRFWRFALSLTGRADRAEDLVQTTCERMLTHADRYAPGTHVDRWGFTVMANLWRSEMRRVEPLPLDEAPEPSDEAADGETAQDRAVFTRQVLDAIDRLPTEQRSAIALVFGEGMTYRQAAETLSVPIGTIMSRIHSGRRRLANELARGERPARHGR
ncbi:MAG: RNA polymerase sigma factor [Parvularculaceae bacterium]